MPKATTSSRATHPFPFFGAGRANYFEWAEVHVRFARAPTPAERKAIAAIVPPPLRDSVRFHGRDLHVASGQFVHHNIYDAYALPDDPVNDENDDDDEIEDGWFFASTAQVNRFNTDTEHWLQAAHNIAPILAAFRREDGEAGGTKLSPWHRKSLARTADVLHECEDVLALGDRYASGAYMVHGILDMAEDGGVAVPDEWKRWHDNPEKEAAKRAKTKKAAKKAPSKKASKKASAEKASAKKTPAKKTPAKKTPAKKTSAKKTSAKKAAKKTAKKTPAKKAPAKKVPAKKAAKKAPAKKAAKKAPTKKAS